MFQPECRPHGHGFAPRKHPVPFVLQRQRHGLHRCIGVGYALFILCSYGIQHIFKIKPFTFSFSELTWDLPLLAVGGAIVIELWSILLENFKRMGFDIIKILLNMFSRAKEVKNEITE